MPNDKAVLAYSGGLDTSVCIRFLQNLHHYDVVTVTVDCGQNENFENIEKNSADTGAIKHIYVDAKEEFARDFVIPCIKANGVYQNKYPLSTALARPLIAAKAIEVANIEGATAIAHGCTGKGNDQLRFDITMHALNPKLKIIAPIRDLNLTRDDEIKFAVEQHIPISPIANKYSVDLNIWGRAIEGGNLEDPYYQPPEDAFQLVKFDNNNAGYLELEFKNGVPSAVDGNDMTINSLIEYVNTKVGSFGVGIIDHIEDRVIGIKSREIYEAPAATAIIEAHKDLEKMVLTMHEIQFKQLVDQQWSWMIYSGLWPDPLRTDLDKFIESTQTRVTGKVRLKLQKGSIQVVGRESPYSLYRTDLATFGAESKFDQGLAKGFVELWGLQSIIANAVANEMKSQNSQKNLA
ncbi:MAG TPA: argininosuccinate synthase, partial [Nitrososphaeraceae archaeon]|nr:argininosuccinate synthase [Nitrososphaeraceae archaeon]